MGRSHKFPAFEGLRGIAAFAVVLYHLHLTFFATSSSYLRARLVSLPDVLAGTLVAAVEGLYNGTFAVWLFWTMSGFVLSLQYFFSLREPDPTRAHDYLKHAALRRYPRLLLPVFASVCFAYLLMRFGAMRNVSLAQTLGHPYEAWLGTWYAFPPSALEAINAAVWRTFFAYDSIHFYNPVLWSMEPEFFGSLFLFAFLSLVGSRRGRVFVYPLVVIVDFRLKLHWLNAFVAGIAACDLYVNSLWRSTALLAFRRSRFGAALLWMLVIICAGLPNYGDVSYLLLALVAVILTLISEPTQQVLSSRLLTFPGKISFGVYLVHLPVICSFSSWAYLLTFASIGPVPAAIVVSVATCVVSVIAGYSLYLIADRPGIRFSKWLADFVMDW